MTTSTSEEIPNKVRAAERSTLGKFIYQPSGKEIVMVLFNKFGIVPAEKADGDIEGEGGR